MNKTGRAILCVCLILNSTIGFIIANENTPKRSKRADAPLEVKVTQWGPTEKDIEAAKSRVERNPAVQSKLKGTKYRLVGFRYIDENAADKSSPSLPPTRYRAFFYDYINDRTITAESDFAATQPVKVSEEASYTGVGIGQDEINAAYEIAKKDAGLSRFAADEKLEFFEPMPPTTNMNGERLVNIGVRNNATGENQIVGVSFKNNKIIRYENNAPLSARVAADECGVPGAQQGSTSDGVPGQYQITVTQNNAPIWEMLVIRPSSSSGAFFERSGIEIRDLKYKSKSVLKRGHAPILNVKYEGNCGPFRDWQYSEGFFNAPPEGATDPAPGIRVLAPGKIATTVVESGNDLGNFQGVAIYQQDVGNGTEVVMVSEMNAGWYRYIMEWRFATDGTIRPRYGYGSVENACVCVPRTHHVYWRFDFDVVSPSNKIMQVERGRKFLRPVKTEAEIFRNYAFNRSFLIQNANGDEAYQITPNLTDGKVTGTGETLIDTFGKGDFWFMRFKGTGQNAEEIDDPNVYPDVSANLSQWINGESLVNEDVVVWYAAHQYRVDQSSRPGPEKPEVLQGKHIVGPDLRPVLW